MLNNLTNFFNLIVGRRIKTQLEDSDLIAVGTKQSPNLGDYKPTAIKFSDLQAQMGAWDMPGVAFVSPSQGDNSTAEIGNGNKPFETITAAANSGASEVYLLPDEYNESHVLVKRVTYYSYPGVVFKSGTLSALNVTLVKTKWLGYSEFENTSNIDLRPESASEFVLEVRRMATTGNTGLFFQATNASDAVFNLGTLDCIVGNTAAPTYSIRGALKAIINIDKIVGYYKTLNLRALTEDVVININEAILLEGGPYGNAGGFKSCLSIEACSSIVTEKSITVNIKRAQSLCATVTNDGIVAISSMPGNWKVFVNIDYAESLANPLIRVNANNINSASTVTIKAGKSIQNRAINFTGLGPLHVKNSTFEQALSSIVTSSILYLSEVSIYNSGLESTLTGSNATAQAYFNNVGTQGDAAAYVYAGVAGCQYGFNNVISNQAIEPLDPVNNYANPGLVTDANYKAPRI
jgi:hypothetical protein